MTASFTGESTGRVAAQLISAGKTIKAKVSNVDFGSAALLDWTQSLVCGGTGVRFQ